MTALLEQMLQLKKVPQSLLFIGGRLEDALDFVKKLFGPTGEAKVTSGNHPDLHLLIPEEKSSLHPMSTIQKLIREMALPPFEAKCKVFIIQDAEKMLPSASNALLKTLEEPSEDTYFILLSSYPDLFLPTILSRLTPVSFVEAEPPSYDMSPYIALAQRGEWDELIDSLKNLEEEDPKALFKAILESVKEPSLFLKLSEKVAEGQKALDHHVKLRAVLLNILLEMSY